MKNLKKEDIGLSAPAVSACGVEKNNIENTVLPDSLKSAYDLAVIVEKFLDNTSKKVQDSLSNSDDFYSTEPTPEPPTPLPIPETTLFPTPEPTEKPTPPPPQ